MTVETPGATIGFNPTTSYNEGVWISSAENGSHLGQSLLKAALRDGKGLVGTESNQDLVDNRDSGFVAGDKAAEVCHVGKNTDLAGVAGFSGKVWACNDIDAIGIVDASVVGDKVVAENQLLQWVSCIDDLDAIFRRRDHHRSDVSVLNGAVCKSQNAVEL